MTSPAPREGVAEPRTFEQMVELATWLAEQDEALRYELIQARKKAGLSQRDVAEVLGIKQSSVASFERHDNDPRLSTIRRYALAVDCAISHHVEEARAWREGGWLVSEKDLGYSVSVRSSSQVSVLAPADAIRTDFAEAA